MLSYRHAFHAGNHADVLKHTIQVQLLRHLCLKTTPYWYIDSHAGAGRYALTEGYAAQNTEYESGISQLWRAENLPPLLTNYIELVREFNPDGQLKWYPGSPALAQKLLRRDDQAWLYELHPADHVSLQQHVAQGDRRVRFYKADGWNGIKALLPPQPRRGLILIDPPYESSNEYGHVLTLLQQGLKRFATGIYAVWYPLLNKHESQQLPVQLAELAPRWLHATLQVKAAPKGFGMYGSGMFIINPPWTLQAALQPVLEVLRDKLGQDQTASFSLTTHGLE